MNYINKFCLVILLFICACGGEVLDDAQNFVPNESPVITSIIFEPSDPTLTNYEENLIPDIPFIIKASAYDPENEGLVYTFTSDHGSFAGQKESDGEVEVVFVTGRMKSGDPVNVKLTVSDPTRRNNEAVEELYIGKAKPKANISIMNGGSPVLAGSTITLSSYGSCPLTIVDPNVNTVISKNKVYQAAKYAMSGVNLPTDECGLKLLYFSI